MILVFRREVAENCALLGCYAESGGNFLPTFRDSLPVPSSRGTAVAQWLRCCATNRKVAGSITAGVSGLFIDIKSFRSHYGPGVDSESKGNEYKEYLLWVNAAGA
jgi:hypothetical protein